MVDAAHSALGFCARYARWVLVAGLVAGLLLQDLAILFKPTIPWFIAGLLFTASLRIGPSTAIGALSEFQKHLGITLIFQLVLPLLLLGLVIVIPIPAQLVAPMVLVAAAAPISGSPNLVMMLGAEPAPALRQLVIGTALLPLTVIPVFFWMPEFGDTYQIAYAVARLLIVIVVASALGFAIRVWLLPELTPRTVDSIDGVSAILMALVVIGLMWALGNAYRTEARFLALMLAFAFLLNFGLQALGFYFWKKTLGDPYAVSLGVISGNRNIALFLTALPASVVDDLFLFIGCYQFPMYLTPLLLKRFYRGVGPT